MSARTGDGVESAGTETADDAVTTSDGGAEVDGVIGVDADGDGDGLDRLATDGRTARRDRNRDAVLDAVIELFTEDMFMPAATEVAERSGVSPRSVYRYFEDAEGLTRAAIDRQLELVEPLFHIPAIGEGPLDERIERFAICRLRLWQAVGPTARAAAVRASVNEVMRLQFEQARQLLRGQVEQMFAPELDDLDTPDRRAVLSAVDVLCEFAGIDHLRRVRGLTDAQTRDALVRALRLLLEPR